VYGSVCEMLALRTLHLIFFSEYILISMERELLTYPTWVRYSVLANNMTNLTIKDRRQIFQSIRKDDARADTFFPKYGFTLSEFAVWHVLGDARRKNRTTGN